MYGGSWGGCSFCCFLAFALSFPEIRFFLIDWPIRVSWKETQYHVMLGVWFSNGKEGSDAELWSKQECVGSTACGVLEGRSETAEKSAAMGFLRIVTWSSSSWTAHPSSCLCFTSSSCLWCLGLLHHTGIPQLWALCPRRDTGQEAELG